MCVNVPSSGGRGSTGVSADGAVWRPSGLSLEQVDILWHCLVEDAECYDDALHWFLNQVRSKDQHAMGMETYKHLFLEKVRNTHTRSHIH